MSLHLKTARLAGWQVRLLCWSGAALWLSGALWLLVHYFGRVQGEFGPEANPAEPWLLRLHGAALLALLLGVGSLLVVHVWRGWAYRQQRWIGLSLLILLGLLVLSGYLLYYAGDEALRAWDSVVHWSVGLVALPVFVWHYLHGRRL
ncbi:MAG: hypothetical protein QM718_08150 [Steroidobacteraceae bacterium]